ncbi:type I polyketide synthase [Streptomyces sp. OE57]|uniref:type I polyketide synthase n=1 Tax=Streptomyces lacaronensis TaxID=3379885 RepID=UPI0039B76714
MTTGAPEDQGADPEAVAVIGMAGRFPMARDIAGFWDNLCAGRDCLEDLDEDELWAAGVPEPVLEQPGYVRRAAVLDGYAEFDAEYFGLPPGTAAAMDPQQRLFLEACVHGLEDAGYDPARLDGAVGVFGAPSFSGYLAYHLLSHRDPADFLGAGTSTELIHALTLTDPNFFATRVAHALDLHGPALTVQTACSGSLVAVHLACQSLLCGESDMALAGGMAVKVPHRVGYLHEPGSMMSADGSCRPFDAAASGTVFGSGGGVVVLKRLSDALADQDRIRAVIRGTAVNNDGSLKMGFTAPSVTMQAAVVAEALAVAGAAPERVGYVEAHGTGTPLGDPVEFDALRRALDPGGDRDTPCLIGSVKGNIGHLEAASGIVGLIKTVVALETRTLPGTAHFREPNPELALDRGRFEITAKTGTWSGALPPLAGVSSLGVGGTNAHVVLEAAPVPVRPPDDGRPRVLLLSARTAEALRDAREALADALGPGTNLADAAYTLAEGRGVFAHRAAVVADRPDRAAEALRTDRAGARAPAEPPAVALLFPGQGAQYPGMGAGLYAGGGAFRRHLDHCAGLFAGEADLDVREAVLGGGGQEWLRRTDVAQPVLFAVEYALARTLEEFGIRPSALGGHSVGEFTAACLAGVMELGDAVRLVAVRGGLMRSAPPGAMLSVRLPEDTTAEMIDGTGLEIAAVNEPQATVVTGPEPAVARLANRLHGRGVEVTALRTAHAFHSSAMEEAAERFAEHAARVPLHAPSVPLVSNLTGEWMTAAEAMDPRRWGRQLRCAVRWSACAATLLKATAGVVVETGPGRALTSAARRSAAWTGGHRAVCAMRHAREETGDQEALLRAVGALWESGAEVDWSALRTGHERPVSLPGYPFRRVRHWTESAYPDRPAAAVPPVPTAVAAGPEPPAAGAGRDGLEGALAEIWAEVLGVDPVAAGDDFFDLGGDSVLATRIARRARARGIGLQPSDLFENPTVARLAARLGTREG